MAPGISWAPVTPSQLPMLRGLGVPCGRPSTRARREGGSRPGGAGSGQLLFCRGSGGSYHPWGARPVSPAVASGPPSLRVRRGLLPRGCCGDMRIPGAFVVSAWGGGQEDAGGGPGDPLSVWSFPQGGAQAAALCRVQEATVSGADRVPSLLGCCSAGGGRAPAQREVKASGEKDVGLRSEGEDRSLSGKRAHQPAGRGVFGKPPGECDSGGARKASSWGRLRAGWALGCCGVGGRGRACQWHGRGNSPGVCILGRGQGTALRKS